MDISRLCVLQGDDEREPTVASSDDYYMVLPIYSGRRGGG